jgi:hypothetical protein
MTCPCTGAMVNRNESFNSLKLEQKKCNMQYNVWNAIEHVINFFNNYQEREGSQRHISPFPGTLQPRKILTNDAFTAQTKIGWGKFLK